MKIALTLILLTVSFATFAQNTATIFGKVTDKKDGLELIGVNVFVKGSTTGASTNLDGKYSFVLNPGTYNIEVSYVGYGKQIFTGITLKAGDRKELNIKLESSVLTIDQDIVIIGEAPLIDIEQTKNEQRIKGETIEAAPSRQIQGILNTQSGVVLNPEGISIRGGRTYETAFLIDGVSATDPLAGTGFGIDLGSNSISEINVTTGGGDVSVGDGTAGIVKSTTKSGGQKFEFTAGHKRDYLGFNRNWDSQWSNSIYEFTMGGPVKLVKGNKLRYFTSFKSSFDDQYFKVVANQVTSTLYPNKLVSPSQDNRWAGMMKWNYDFSSKKRLDFTYLKSMTINQDRNMLRIIGNDVPFSPGFQYDFMLQPDNATTFTHDTNMETLNWNHTVSNKFSYKVTASRLFVRLRADANGRPWRPTVVNQEFDPNVIVDFPVNYFNPNDSIVFVLPGPGLYNNGGISTIWHDHYVEEYTFRFSGNYYYGKSGNRINFGGDAKPQTMQWIDITRPWIGAPVQLANGEYTQSFRLGDYSDVWKVSPLRGSFFISDKIKYKGLIVDVGFRTEYWFPGKFVDDAIKNPKAPIRDEFRESYIANSVDIFGRRMKMRILPKVSASFPIRDNQVMFFNYNHSMILPHPSFIYQGLNPLYQDRSAIGRIGNPDLNPEVDISYELGLRSQITKDDALTLSAYWKDKYDFITSSTIVVKDVTGRETSKTIRINSDYARVRGLEATYLKRVGKWFSGQIAASYMVARGQSSSANESLNSILLQSNRENTKERPLVWDSPLDLKTFGVFTLDNKEGFFGSSKINKMSLYVEGVYRTGRRYTPYIYSGNDPTTGRPIYDIDPNPDAAWSKLGSSMKWVDLNYRKWWFVGKSKLEFVVQLTNALNAKNTIIPNPVTGTAYTNGDPVPSTWRDPNYLDPRDGRSFGQPPTNPARYMAPRHLMLGINFKW